MKRILSFVLLAATAISAIAADVTGKWAGNLLPESGNPGPALLILKQEGTKVTGSAGPNEDDQFTIENGKIDGNNVSFEGHDANGGLFKIAIAVSGDQAKGTVERTREDGTTQTAKIEVTRAK